MFFFLIILILYIKFSINLIESWFCKSCHFSLYFLVFITILTFLFLKSNGGRNVHCVIVVWSIFCKTLTILTIICINTIYLNWVGFNEEIILVKWGALYLLLYIDLYYNIIIVTTVSSNTDFTGLPQYKKKKSPPIKRN